MSPVLSSVFRVLILLTASIACCPASWAGEPDCTLHQLFSFENAAGPGETPKVAGSFGEQPLRFIIDTGGIAGMFPRSLAGGLTIRSVPGSGSLIDGSGASITEFVKVPEFKLGQFTVRDSEFLLGNVASLGANVLKRMDVEFDPVDRKINLYSHAPCKNKVVYWPHTDLAVIPFDIDRNNWIRFSVDLDGQDLRAVLDTGTYLSMLSTPAARQHFDVDPKQLEAGYSQGTATGASLGTYRKQFEKLDLGGVTVLRPTLHIGGNTRTNLIIGMDVIATLHVYIAYEEEKLYISSQRGDLDAGRKPSASGADLADSLDSINAETEVEDAMMRLKTKDSAQALAELDRAVGLAPLDPKPLLARGAFHRDRGDSAAALADANAAIRLDGRLEAAYRLRASIEVAEKDYGRALTDALDEVRLAPADPQARMDLGLVKLQHRDEKGAIESFDAARVLAPKWATPLAWLSNVHRVLRQYDQALKEAEGAVHLAPKWAPALSARCRVEALLGKLDDATSDCDAAVAAAPQFVEAQCARAFIYFKAGRLDAALAEYDAVIARSPDWPEALYGRGLVRRQKGDEAGAATDITAAQKLQPDVAEAFGT
ncbi:MAG TPA: aspartyl protease family protein [Stellaceae bacterium]|nr:aspartyl protease family protein [Stellaceae bacterium]